MGASQSSPVGGGGVGVADSCPCANGVVFVGSRVKTQYTRAEGGDDRWYAGTIRKVFANGRATVHYDDGDKWTGDAEDIYLLNPAPNAPTAQPSAHGPPMTVHHVTVPAGAGPGQLIPVVGPGGASFSVQVPPGMTAGSTFAFQMPAATAPYAASSSQSSAYPAHPAGSPPVVMGTVVGAPTPVASAGPVATATGMFVPSKG